MIRRIKLDDSERRIISVKVKAKSEEEEVIYEVPMPLLNDRFHINGIVYKVSYQRENPFRISAEPTGEAVLEVVEEFWKSQQASIPPKDADVEVKDNLEGSVDEPKQ